MKIDPNKTKLDFPIFKNHPEMIYLDSASTSQKPQIVIDTVTQFYTTYNSNIHRGIYKLSEEATKKYEGVREKVAKFIGAWNSTEVIFTKNANEAINLVAEGWAKNNLRNGDIVVLSEMEHHANIVPWLRLKEKVGIILYYLPLTSDFRLDYQQLLNQGFDLGKIKLLSLTHVSNVLGTINPIAGISKFLKENNIKAKICVDAAQSIPHFSINIKRLGCDFLAFSSHKMLGPSGVGVLWAKFDVLESMEPLLVGSHMISTVSKDNVTFAALPDRFEVGTANLEGVIGLGTAIDYLQNLGMDNIFEYDESLTEYGLQKLLEIKGLKLFGPNSSKERLAIFSFGFEGIHPHDIAQILDEENIAIRSGHHCAQTLMECLKEPATARASFYIYNTKDDIERLIKGLEKVKQILKPS